MATLVLDNGAYTAKIGYSQEKVRYVVSKRANVSANNKRCVQLICLKHVRLQHSVINTSSHTRRNPNDSVQNGSVCCSGRIEMDERRMQNVSWDQTWSLKAPCALREPVTSSNVLFWFVHTWKVFRSGHRGGEKPEHAHTWAEMRVFNLVFLGKWLKSNDQLWKQFVN